MAQDDNQFLAPVVVLKYGGIPGLIVLLISWALIWRTWAVIGGLILLAITLTWRFFKWWVYRGTINMGKKRQMKNKRNSIAIQSATNYQR